MSGVTHRVIIHKKKKKKKGTPRLSSIISKKIIGLEQSIRSGWPIPWMGTLYFGPPCSTNIYVLFVIRSYDNRKKCWS